MVDFQHDYRGINNRYEIRKHNNRKKKREFCQSKRTRRSFIRTPARSCVKNTLVALHKCSVGENWSEILEPAFHTRDDCWAFELHDLIETDDIDGIGTLLLYSVPDSFEKSISICRRQEGWKFYSIETTLIAAARQVNDRSVQMFINKCSTANIYLTTDASYELKRYKTNTYGDGLYWIFTSSDDILNKHYSWSGHVSLYDESIDWEYDDCLWDCFDRCGGELGRTALWFACYYGHLNVVRSLIEIGKADVLIADQRNKTPLRVAISRGHTDIVQYLMEQSQPIMDETCDFSVAIIYGNYDIIVYLLDKGCDPNTRLINECTMDWSDDHTYFALHYTINHRSQNLSIIKTLLKHGSDPTIKDKNDETALHIAIRHQNKEIIEEILHYGFKHDQTNGRGLTPLMLAIDMNLTDITDLFYQTFPRQQYIDEIMLLAAHYTLEYKFNFDQINPRAFIYFEQGLELQASDSNAVPCDAYKLRRECQTIDELITIQFIPELMYIQGLLVYERLLLQRNDISLLIPKLFSFAEYYFNIVDYEQCLLILMHLYPLILSCKENTSDKYCLQVLTNVLGFFILQENIKYIDYVLQAFKWTLKELHNDNLQLCRLCIYVAYLIEIHQIDLEKKRQLIYWVKGAINLNYASTSCKNILFHEAIVICLRNTEPFFDRISHRKFLNLLVYCGVDVNEYCGYRPLHQVALHSSCQYAQSVIEILIAAGIHTDCRDYQGLLPEERALNLEIRNYLHTNRSWSLKCQCAQLIISEKIKHQSYLSHRLNSFILMHQSR